MSDNIKRQTGRTFLEQEGLTQQLERAGLEVHRDGLIVPDSMANVKGGAEAVAAAAGSDALLSANEAAQLRAKGLLGALISPISDRSTRNIQSLAMVVDGLSALFRDTEVSEAQAKTLGRRAQALEKQLSGLIEGTQLGKASPESRVQLADALIRLTNSSSAYLAQLVGRKADLDAVLDAGADRLVNGSGFGNRLGGLGLAFAASTGVVAYRALIDRIRPLTILTTDLISVGGPLKPIERFAKEALGGVFNSADTQLIAETMAHIERSHRYRGITRHEVSEAIDRLLGRHYGKIGLQHGADRIARQHAGLLEHHPSLEIRRAIAGETTDLTVSEVFAAMLEVAAGAAKDGRKDFFNQLDI